jgi:hypothetical protein
MGLKSVFELHHRAAPRGEKLSQGANVGEFSDMRFRSKRFSPAGRQVASSCGGRLPPKGADPINSEWNSEIAANAAIFARIRKRFASLARDSSGIFKPLTGLLPAGIAMFILPS